MNCSMPQRVFRLRLTSCSALCCEHYIKLREKCPPTHSMFWITNRIHAAVSIPAGWLPTQRDRRQVKTPPRKRLYKREPSSHGQGSRKARRPLEDSSAYPPQRRESCPPGRHPRGVPRHVRARQEEPEAHQRKPWTSRREERTQRSRGSSGRQHRDSFLSVSSRGKTRDPAPKRRDIQ
jgi:hypothetical protein